MHVEDHTYPSVHSMHVHIHGTSSQTQIRRLSEPSKLLWTPLQPRITTTLTSNTRNLPSPPLFWTSWKWLHAMSSFVSGVFHSPSCLWDSSTWLHIVLDGHMGCFQFGALRNSAASNIPTHISWFIDVPISAGQTPRSEELHHGTGISQPWYVFAKECPKIGMATAIPTHTVGEFPVAPLFRQHSHCLSHGSHSGGHTVLLHCGHWPFGYPFLWTVHSTLLPHFLSGCLPLLLLICSSLYIPYVTSPMNRWLEVASLTLVFPCS